MLAITLASLRSQGRRFLAPGLAIVLGVAFVAATLVLGTTVTSSTQAALTGNLRTYAAVVSPDDGAEVPAAALATVEADPDVTAVRALRDSGIRLSAGAVTTFARLTSPPSPTSSTVVTSGVMPSAAGEVAISASLAERASLSVGSTVRIDSAQFDASNPVAEKPSDATVVGIVDPGDDPLYAGGTPVAFATTDQVGAWTGQQGYSELDVTARDGVDATALATTLGSALGAGVTVRTGPDQAAHLVTQVTGGTDFITIVLLGFALIAVFVSMLVIANTFAILLARRARETALLRAVGATRSQVTRLALGEAVVMGAVSSAVGVLTGIGLARALVAVAGSLDLGINLSTFAVPVTAVLVPFAVGVVVAVLASILPVIRSGRVSPLAALRPSAAVALRSRAGVVRIGSGLALMGLGGWLLAMGSTEHSLPLGMSGGALSFLGVLLAATLLVPLAARGIGSLATLLAGAPGRLAVDNAVRNPRRAAATSSALLVGVTLIAMMSVGTATAKGSIDGLLADQYPVDVTVTTPGAMPDAMATALAQTDGVEDSAVLRRGTLTVGDADRQDVVGIPTSAGAVARTPDLLTQLTAGTLLVADQTAQQRGLADGDTVSVTGPAGSRDLRVRLDSSLGFDWVLPESDLIALDPGAGAQATWLRLADTADVSEVFAAVTAIADTTPGTEVSGSASEREQIMSALDIMLAVVIGLLAIAVVIAVIGIGNTLSLSVLERTQESALLRAIGLTRGQLRAMLGIEAALLAVVAAAIGTGLGILYGWTGVLTAIGSAGPMTLTVPWDQIALIAGAALLAGVLASVLPARRAARTAPAAALAAD